jgi:tetratricopeptide (TPR) repeat protein
MHMPKKNLAVFTLGFCVIVLAGCSSRTDVQKARMYLRQSQEDYRRSVGIYTRLIAQGTDTDALHFELGQLYYDHARFLEAITELNQTGRPEAKKMLAIAYYHLGDFTRALQLFGKNDVPDDECLYYYGLTCEKLNLYDRALELYKKIASRAYAGLAAARVEVIEKQATAVRIDRLNPATAKIIASAGDAQNFPQAGALVLWCDEKIEITSENTQVSSMHYVVKILNERGKEAFAETGIDYDSTYEKVDLVYARTIKPDGEVAEVGSRHIRDVSKYLNFPLYSNARVFIISFPEITEGAVIEYEVKISGSEMINKKDFILGYPLQSSQPILSADFSVTLPQDKSLFIRTINENYNNFGADLKPRVEQVNGQTTYRWHFRDIPQVIPESNMPPEVQINPAILLSTFSSWQQVYGWWWKLAQDKIKADTAIRQKVGELVAGLVSDDDRARAVYNFCAQKIRYVAVEYGQAGYEPHRAEDIFKNKYGDCKDQAILLVTMLKEAGFTAWPVLIATRDYYDLNQDFPAVLFNHCIAAVSFKGQLVFLDPTAETCPFGDLPGGDQRRAVLVIKDDGYAVEQTPLYPPQHNLVRQHLAIRVNPDETITAAKDVTTSGIYGQSQRYWLRYTPPELVEQTLKEKIQSISIGSRLEGYQIQNKDDLNQLLALRYTFQGPEYFTTAGRLRLMPQLTEADASVVAKDTRKYPIDFGVLDTKETIIEVAIPATLKVQYIPEDVAIDSPWVRFDVRYTRKGNTLYFDQKIEVKTNNVPVQEYGRFKSLYEDLAKKIKQRVVLEEVR